IAAQVFAAIFEKGERLSPALAEKFVAAGLDALLECVRETENLPALAQDLRHAQLEKVMGYVRANFARSGLTTADIADACNISRRHLHNLFQTAGYTPSEFLWKTRVSH